MSTPTGPGSPSLADRSSAAHPATVLVTGANGTIGREVVRQLAARGDTVVALALDLDSPAPFPAQPGVHAVQGDCTSEPDVLRALSEVGPVTGVVHLAALAHIGAGTPVDVFSTNVVSTFTVLAHAAAHGARRAVLASSIHATGVPNNHHGLLPEAFPLGEDDRIALDDWYSLSKRTDELTAGMVASRWGMPVVALRFPLVKGLAELAEASLRLQRDPASGVREGWTYLTLVDAGRAVLCALDAQTEGADVLHVAAADTLLPAPTDELLDSHAPGVARHQRFPGRSSPMDTSRARERIGFVPQESLALPVLPSTAAHGPVHPDRPLPAVAPSADPVPASQELP